MQTFLCSEHTWLLSGLVQAFLVFLVGSAWSAPKMSWGLLWGVCGRGPRRPFHTPSNPPHPANGGRRHSSIGSFLIRGSCWVWSRTLFLCWPGLWTVQQGAPWSAASLQGGAIRHEAGLCCCACSIVSGQCRKMLLNLFHMPATHHLPSLVASGGRQWVEGHSGVLLQGLCPKQLYGCAGSDCYQPKHFVFENSHKSPKAFATSLV